jgi:hypothetical protein
MGRHAEVCNLGSGLHIWLPAEMKPPVEIHVISNVQKLMKHNRHSAIVKMMKS